MKSGSETTKPSNPTTWSDQLVDLYLNHRDSLVRTAAGVVRDQSLAEECVQDAFLKYHTKACSPRPGSEVGYLRTMVRNEARNLLRRRAREMPTEVPERAAAQAPVADAAVSAIELQELIDCLEILSPRQATMIEMRHFRGLSVQETADCLDITSGTVKTHTHRATTVLRECLQAA